MAYQAVFEAAHSVTGGLGDSETENKTAEQSL